MIQQYDYDPDGRIDLVPRKGGLFIKASDIPSAPLSYAIAEIANIAYSRKGDNKQYFQIMAHIEALESLMKAAE